jgi:hypothetical protein
MHLPNSEAVCKRVGRLGMEGENYKKEKGE